MVNKVTFAGFRSDHPNRPSPRISLWFVTTGVIQISTTPARYIHWTSCSDSKTYYFILNSLDVRNEKSHKWN